MHDIGAHGVNGIANFRVKPNGNEYNMTIEMYDKNSELTMLESEFNLMFIRMASYYKIDGVNSWAKTIYSKIWCNVLNQPLMKSFKIISAIR